MLLTILSASLSLLSAAASGQPPAPVHDRSAEAQARCDALRPRLVRPDETPRPQRLDRLPPGRLELSVYREVDGCPIPAVLREGLGGAAAGH